MADAPYDGTPWPQGRAPRRRRIGLLGWALLALLAFALFLLAPR